MLKLEDLPATRLESCTDAVAAYERLAAIYAEGLAATKQYFKAYADGRLDKRAENAVYPYLCADVAPTIKQTRSTLAFGEVACPGWHGTTVTAPALFREYLLEQIALLQENHDAQLYVGYSKTPIPLTFALERSTAKLDPEQRYALAQHFELPDLAATNDAIVDVGTGRQTETVMPLSLFPAERVDYSLHRLRHYTATAPEHFQRFVLFTNYQRYVDEFCEYGRVAVDDGEYERFVEPGNRIYEKNMKNAEAPVARLPQMPAYHLVRENAAGITLVNIGVGPSNAKTITDHIAVLRPHVWLMIGHCGGLRGSQQLGDYVLAHAYLRDDNVLDQVLPSAIPLPTIAEVQVALAAAVSDVTATSGADLKDRLRTGTVVTTDDRNWELRYHELALRFNQSRAIGIDMESATIAANGYRFRVPYGTLLCVSDRPLHGEIKLPGMASAFYEARVAQHLDIGIRAIELLRNGALQGTLHSRKLRSFDEPAFR